ncbi:uncharacterized protein LOC121803798 [Salvia splendens]|uniref:uncharacterized protein LOC121803798 n=1 Tax=Salvia splendens TaxID=180675 RepID=UPI001C278A19|nr:uncharacterized protein LOC121803798 [Salvia splendens]
MSWLSSMLGELKIKKKRSPVIWVDNMSAITLASNPVLHARTKHIELDIHFVRDKVLGKEIELRHVPTADQVADIFTKPLSHQPFVKMRERLGVVSLASLGLRGCVGRDSQADQAAMHDLKSLDRQADQAAMHLKSLDRRVDQAAAMHLKSLDRQVDQAVDQAAACQADQAVDQADACQVDQAVACNTKITNHVDQCMATKQDARDKQVINSTRAKVIDKTKERTKAGTPKEPIRRAHTSYSCE